MTTPATGFKKVRRLITVWLTLLSLAVLAGGITEDHRSCSRQKPVRNALRIYALNAAQARELSARHERLADPLQARIDTEAAVRFRQSAAEVPSADCSSLIPGT